MRMDDMNVKTRRKEVKEVKSYVKSQGSQILWNDDVFLESMFCLINLLRLVMLLHNEVT